MSERYASSVAPKVGFLSLPIELMERILIDSLSKISGVSVDHCYWPANKSIFSYYNVFSLHNNKSDWIELLCVNKRLRDIVHKLIYRSVDLDVTFKKMKQFLIQKGDVGGLTFV